MNETQMTMIDPLRKEMDDCAYVIACAVANGRQPAGRFVDRFVELRDEWLSTDDA
jgi:hypothetical protein